MKNTQLSFIGFLISVSWLLSSAMVNAQTNVTIDPDVLTIVGLRHQNKVEKRLIYLTNEAINISQVKVSLREPYRTDRLAVFPIGAIESKTPYINPNQPNELIIPVDFTLQQAPSSGEFQGKLIINYQSEKLSIPVIIKIKDYWLLPISVLVIGTLLGITISSYRAKGRPRDEILVREGELRTQIQSDLDLVKVETFKNQIEAYLIDVKIALQGERWQDGENAIQGAESIWSKWLKERTSWLKQFDYADKIKERLQDQNPNLPYIQEVHRHLDNVLQQAPELENSKKLREHLAEITQQVNRFLQVQEKIKQLKNLFNQLPTEEAKNWQTKLLNWEQRIDKLLPSDFTKDTDLDNELEEAIAQMTQLVSQQEGIAKGLPTLGITLLELAPPARPLNWQTRVTNAGLRLRLLTWTSYVVAVVFLAGAGFIELYVEKDTFGANPVQDYFALLAWGFGAEASRDAITEMVQGWGLSGLK